jgi:chaperonin cofactor prefoldin
MTTRAATFLLIFLGLATRGVSAQSAQGLKFSSRDEYRSCLEEGDKLTPRLAVLQARLKDHNQAMKRLQDEMVAHVATQPAVDTNDQAAVDEFNTKIESLNLRMQAMDDQGDEFNKEQIAYNTQVAAMNKRCAGMVVTLNDRDAVRRERLAQGKK